MKRKFNETLILVYSLIFITSFALLGWSMAEQDNEILRKELSIYTNKEIFK